MASLAHVGIALTQIASSMAPSPSPSPSPSSGAAVTVAPSPREMDVTVGALGPRRRVGVHLGLNATLTVDLALGRYVYGGFTTQLTGIGALFDPQRNFVVSALVFGGVALPLVDNGAIRLTVDVTPMASYFHSAPVNMLNVGLLAGLRLVHVSGFTAAIRLPLVGYAGAPDAQRGGILYYYIGAIPTVPILTVGYTF